MRVQFIHDPRDIRRVQRAQPLGRDLEFQTPNAALESFDVMPRYHLRVRFELGDSGDLIRDVHEAHAVEQAAHTDIDPHQVQSVAGRLDSYVIYPYHAIVVHIDDLFVHHVCA